MCFQRFLAMQFSFWYGRNYQFSLFQEDARDSNSIFFLIRWALGFEKIDLWTVNYVLQAGFCILPSRLLLTVN
jgi:hypothetical protein